jgi:predicted nucleic acid-binding protein
MIVLDASVLIAFADPDDAHHEAARQIMKSGDQLCVCALTGAEAMVSASPAQRQQWLALFASFSITVLPITAADMPGIAAMRAESRLRMPDALVLYAARQTEAKVASFDHTLLSRAANLGISTI